jgi:hypothetical protein
MGYSTGRELKAAGVLLHYYSMGKSENIKQIARMVDALNSLTTLLFNTVSGLDQFFLRRFLKVYI